MVKPLKPPHYAKDAIPTTRGWVRKGELIVSRRHTQSQIDQYMNKIEQKKSKTKVEEKVETPMQPQVLVEAPTTTEDYQFEHMTKSELTDYAQENGIEVDSRMRKTELVEFLKEQTS